MLQSNGTKELDPFGRLRPSRALFQLPALAAVLMSLIMTPSALAQDKSKEPPSLNKQLLDQLQSTAASLLNDNASKQNLTNKPLLLKATITHSDVKPEVSAQYRSGSEIGRGQMESLTADNYWYRVPEWAAGRWQWDKQTRLSLYNDRTGAFNNDHQELTARKDEIVGFQRDNRGDIWDFESKNAMAENDLGYTLDFNRHMDILDADESKMTYRVDTTRSSLAKYNNFIQSTVQVEGIGVIARDGESAKTVSQSLKLYDQFGQPVTTTQLVARVTKISPFAPVDNYKGRDMRKLFNEFLQSHGMSDRINTP